MAFQVGQLSAPITADDSSFRKTIDRVHRQGITATSKISEGFKSIGSQMRRTGLIMTAAVTAPVVAGMNKMVNEAALLEGAMAKFNVVFGDSSDMMQQWVKEFRENVPLATSDIIKHAASMQDLLVPMGIARDEATGMSKDWLELASALAAFNDVPVEQALEAIRSGIAGMSRPLRQFGIDARETALQQTAIAEGLMKAGDEMSEQVRQQALLLRAYDQSKDAVDGYEDQQDSLLLIQQDVTASVKDLAASFGQLLIPSAKRMGRRIASMIKRITNLDDSTKRLVLGVGSLAAAIPLVTLAIGGLATAMGALLSPIGLTIAAIGGLVVIGKNVIDNWDVFAAELDHLWKGIVLTFQTGVKEVALAMNHIGLLGDETFTEISKSTAEMRRQFLLAGIQAEIERENLVGLGDSAKDLLGSLGDLIQGWADYAFAVEGATQKGIGFKEVTTQITEPVNMVSEGLANMGAQAVEGFEGMTSLQVAMQGFTSDADKGNAAAVQFGQALGQAMSQAVIHAKRFDDVLKNILKQLASQALMQFVTAVITGGSSLAAGSIGKAIFGGLFHDGGIIPGGAKERMVRVRPGEGIFTQGQMRALGNMNGGGGGISESGMQRAFDRALGKHLKKLGPEEIFAMSKRGQFIY